MLKILTGQRETTWAIYKRGQGFELGAIIKQIQIAVRARLEPETLDCESEALTTRPLYLILHPPLLTFNVNDAMENVNTWSVEKRAAKEWWKVVENLTILKGGFYVSSPFKR